MRKAIWLGLAAALAGPVAAREVAPDPNIFAGDGKWTLDYNINACTLSRGFKSGEATMQLAFIPQTGTQKVKVALLSNDRSRLRGYGVTMVTPAGGRAMRRDYYAVPNERGSSIAMVVLMRPDVTTIAAVRSVAFKVGATPFSVPTAGLKSSIAALEACETDLIKSWGYDPERQARPPVAIGAGSWIKNSEYPADALRQNIGGETAFRVSVSAEGKPTACFIVDSSLSKILDEQTCALIMKRGRWTPALGQDGKPVAGFWATSVRWAVGWSQR